MKQPLSFSCKKNWKAFLKILFPGVPKSLFTDLIKKIHFKKVIRSKTIFFMYLCLWHVLCAIVSWWKYWFRIQKVQSVLKLFYVNLSITGVFIRKTNLRNNKIHGLLVIVYFCPSTKSNSENPKIIGKFKCCTWKSHKI